MILNCAEARKEMSAYLNRDLEGERHQALERHLADCRGCLDEAELMQVIVAGLRAMPIMLPPPDFVQRTLARWAALVRGGRTALAGHP